MNEINDIEPICFGDNYENWRKMIEKAEKSIVVFSPYITGHTLFDLFNSSPKNIPIQLFIDFDLENFINYSSSLSVIIQLKRQFKDRINIYKIDDRKLHAKLLLIDDKYVSIGSQNFTARGRENLEITLNQELETKSKESVFILEIDNFKSKCSHVTDEDIAKYRNILTDRDTNEISSVEKTLNLIEVYLQNNQFVWDDELEKHYNWLNSNLNNQSMIQFSKKMNLLFDNILYKMFVILHDSILDYNDEYNECFRLKKINNLRINDVFNFRKKIIKTKIKINNYIDKNSIKLNFYIKKFLNTFHILRSLESRINYLYFSHPLRSKELILSNEGNSFLLNYNSNGDNLLLWFDENNIMKRKGHRYLFYNLDNQKLGYVSLNKVVITKIRDSVALNIENKNYTINFSQSNSNEYNAIIKENNTTVNKIKFFVNDEGVFDYDLLNNDSQLSKDILKKFTIDFVFKKQNKVDNDKIYFSEFLGNPKRQDTGSSRRFYYLSIIQSVFNIPVFVLSKSKNSYKLLSSTETIRLIQEIDAVG